LGVVVKFFSDLHGVELARPSASVTERACEGGFSVLLTIFLLEPVLSSKAPNQPHRISSRLTRGFSINKFLFLPTVEHTIGTQSTA
jgi:hypothetical protein